MARTRNTPKRAEQAIQAAALPLYPRSPQVDEYSYRVIDYIVNNGDGNDEIAWAFYRAIPELHYLVSLMGNAMSQVRLYVGQTDAANPDNPTPVGPRHPARDLMRGFAGGDQGQAELLNKLAVHLTVTGDSILVGPNTDGSLPYPYDHARVYSTSEVSSRSGRIFVKGPNYREEQIPQGSFATRIWKSNPQEFWRADSPVKASLAVLREIDLLNKHVQATTVSRLKGAGVWMIPEEMTLPGAEVEVEGESVDPFVAVLTEVMSLAIKDPGSAAALVPIILRGPAEFIGQAKLEDFSTQFDSMIIELRNNAIRRLALGLDSPPEVLLGSAESSSWSMWQISEAQLRLHIKPMAHLIASSLTEGWLKPTLATLPLADQTKESIPDLVIWPDFSQLNIRPDVGQDAAALYQQHLISDEAYRHILGLGDGDAPDPAGLELQILIQLIASNPQLAPWAIKALTDDFGIPFPDISDALTIGQGAPPEEAPPPVDDLGLPLPGVGTPPAAELPGSAPQIPGERSAEAQTATQEAPPIDGEPSNNQPNSPA